MKKPKLLGSGTLLAGFVVLAMGCAAQIKYTPIAGPAVAPTTNVALLALQVVDNRPPDKLKNKNEVGQVRNGIGIPSGIDDKDPDVVPRTVSEATTDALKLAGVGVQGGQKRLLATVTEFWMDGYMGYKAGVTVQYALQGPSGAPLWTQEIKGAAGGHQRVQRWPQLPGAKPVRKGAQRPGQQGQRRVQVGRAFCKPWRCDSRRGARRGPGRAHSHPGLSAPSRLSVIGARPI